MNLILWFKDCSYKNKNIVGGKCSSLGELYHLSQKIGFSIADGFSVTTNLYDLFLQQNNLTVLIEEKLNKINTDDIDQLENDSEEIRNLISSGDFTFEQIDLIKNYYNELCLLYNRENIEVAVRSSAICEDLENASFAGQQDTYLNIKGIDNLIVAIKKCFASLFTSRAISYRKRFSIDYKDVKLSAAIQKMVRSDIGSAGVAFSIDPETGYNKAVIVNCSYGLGESVVAGLVTPDEFILDKRVLEYTDKDAILTKKLGNKDTKIIYNSDGVGTIEVESSHYEKTNFCLTNEQVMTLGRYVSSLEKAYSEMLNKHLGVDTEFAVDGIDNKIYIIQTRAETVHSNNSELNIKKYILNEKSNVLTKGIAVGEKISTGKVKVLNSVKEHHLFNDGDILVTKYTTPDWESIMRKASALITEKGSRTCHAAIISREFGLNAVVGCNYATTILNNEQEVTVSCAEGEEGHIYDGILDFHIEEMKISNDMKLPIKLKLNIGNPETSFADSLIPNDGVGLGRMEFIINNYIGIHPNALIQYPNIHDLEVKNKISEIIGEGNDGKQYFIERLARGIAKIASPFYPKEVIIRLSDFKSSEYRNLVGGYLYEPHEENPHIGQRGAFRYYYKDFSEAFELECKAIKYARENMMMDNIILMIPFCRTTNECQKVIEIMKNQGLVRGQNNLKIYIMMEIVSNVIEADEFSQFIDGVSVGSNDLQSSCYQICRESEVLTQITDHTGLSFRRLVKMGIETYKKNGVATGFCGEAVSSSIELCKFLIDCGIDSISVTSDVAIKTMFLLSKDYQT
jgi:pyruvate,water dikinase